MVTQVYRTLRVAPSGKGVHGVVIDAPPMNLIGPELVRDLVTLFGPLESDQETRVVVLESADLDYSSRTWTSPRSRSTPPKRPKRAGPMMRPSACGGASSATCRSCRSRRSAAGPAGRAANWRWRAICASPPGRTPSWDRSRSAPAPPPGAGGVQHLARLLGRGRATEAILGVGHFSAEVAERYGWVNRALPDTELDAFVARLARRIASFPVGAVRSAKRVLNELTLPGADAIRADARRFQQLVHSDPVKTRLAGLFAQGLQTRGPLELNLGERIGAL